MNIGILTFHRAHNYGAMLQAYALRTVLQNAGHQVEFVDYWPHSHQTHYQLIKPIRGKDLIAKIKNIIFDTLTFTRRFKRINQFERFAKYYLGVPKQVKYPQDQPKISDTYDLVVVGSDQIWRNHIIAQHYIGFDSVYFCQNFTTKMKCITYAASMGIINLTSAERSDFTRYLQTFNTLLVRENKLRDLIDECGYQAKVVLDPTLLLSKKQWNKLLPSTRFQQRKYVLFYNLLTSEEALMYAKQKAQTMNCELLILDSAIQLLPQKGHISYASPIDFIHAIRDAEYVIATSFHGTVFSIIFEKQFQTTGLGKNADRVVTLLNSLGISERYSESAEVTSAINYLDVIPRLSELRNASLNALYNATIN